jgi:hypothetical protein
MNGFRFVGGRLRRDGVRSWAPTLTSHDPNPPLPLESGGAPPTYFGILKRWTGAVWIKEPDMRWSGAAWVSAVTKRWTGVAWVTVDTTGV